MSAAFAAEKLGTSHSLIHVWIGQGVLKSEQRVRQSYQWVRLTEEDVARLDGQHDWSRYPTVRQVMAERGLSREAVWDLVRAGEYVAYRHRVGQAWEWRLRRAERGLAEHSLTNVSSDACLTDSG